MSSTVPVFTTKYKTQLKKFFKMLRDIVDMSNNMKGDRIDLDKAIEGIISVIVDYIRKFNFYVDNDYDEYLRLNKPLMDIVDNRYVWYDDILDSEDDIFKRLDEISKKALDYNKNGKDLDKKIRTEMKKIFPKGYTWKTKNFSVLKYTFDGVVLIDNSNGHQFSIPLESSAIQDFDNKEKARIDLFGIDKVIYLYKD